MERVAFIVEDTGVRISSLLNPEHVIHRRVAGLRPAMAGSALLSGATLTDTPLLHTGGGRTELDLELLFDVDLVEAPAPALRPKPPDPFPGTDNAVTPDAATAGPVQAAPQGPRDVRDLTRPLWELAENSAEGGRGVPHVRFLWGKAWNVLAVVESLAERLERFDSGGNPGRSWLRLRLVRVPEPEPSAPGGPTEAAAIDPQQLAEAALDPLTTHAVVGGGPGEPGSSPAGGQTVPEIAAAYYGGRAWLWRLIAAANDLTDEVVWPSAGRELVVPSPPSANPGPAGGATPAGIAAVPRFAPDSP